MDNRRFAVCNFEISVNFYLFQVEIMTGQDKGKQGIINQVIQERNWVLVEGLNCHLRVIGKTKDFPGIYIRSEAPLLVTNQVKLVDPSDL